MGRQLRIEYTGALYHVMSHGNGFQWIYKEKAHLDLFKAVLIRSINKYGVKIHAVVLMRNHYHMLIETPEANLSRFMKRFNQEFARLFNIQAKRTGSIIRDRYKAILIEKEPYYLNVLRYIGQNPVRQSIVKRCEEYEGSSIKWLGVKGMENYIYIDDIKERFGGGQRWRKSFIKWMNDGIEENPMEGMEYKYLLGGKEWIKGVGSRIKKKLGGEIIEKRKYRGIGLDVAKFEREVKATCKRGTTDVLIYTYATCSGMTVREIVKKLRLKSEAAAYQRLYRYKKLLDNNADQLQYQKALEKRFNNVKC